VDCAEPGVYQDHWTGMPLSPSTNKSRTDVRHRCVLCKERKAPRSLQQAVAVTLLSHQVVQ
jgi:hypothetical protein